MRRLRYANWGSWLAVVFVPLLGLVSSCAEGSDGDVDPSRTGDEYACAQVCPGPGVKDGPCAGGTSSYATVQADERSTGIAIAPLGADVNANGVPDLIVRYGGGACAVAGACSSGSVRVEVVDGRFGSGAGAAGDGSPVLWQFVLPQGGPGVSVAALDADGSGPTVAIGLPLERKVLLYRLAELAVTRCEVGPTCPAWAVLEAPDVSKFGFRVVRSADLDGDRNDELLVAGATRVSLHAYSRTDGTWRTLATHTESAIIGAVDVPGDVDGDGKDDFLVGLPDAGTGGTARVFSGGACAAGACTEITFARPLGATATAGSAFGWSVAGLGDLDRDGRADFAVGAPRAAGPGCTPACVSAGVVHVFSGATGRPIHSIYGSAAEARLGTVLSGPGDIDGDGWRDIVAQELNRVRGFSGLTGAEVVSHTAPRSAFGRGYGDALAGAGDVNGDRVADYVIGTSWEPTLGSGIWQCDAADVTGDGTGDTLAFSDPEMLSTQVECGARGMECRPVAGADSRCAPDALLADACASCTLDLATTCSTNADCALQGGSCDFASRRCRRCTQLEEHWLVPRGRCNADDDCNAVCPPGGACRCSPLSGNCEVRAASGWWEALVTSCALTDSNANGVPDDCERGATPACPDVDQDGVDDADDLCPGVFDPLQVDSDGDGIGNLCDDDDDSDGVVDARDNCPLVFNPRQAEDDPLRYGALCTRACCAASDDPDVDCSARVVGTDENGAPREELLTVPACRQVAAPKACVCTAGVCATRERIDCQAAGDVCRDVRSEGPRCIASDTPAEEPVLGGPVLRVFINAAACRNALVCSGHGTCASATACACETGWAGRCCDQPVGGQACVRDADCGPNGSCDRFSGTCICDAGWAGLTCNQARQCAPGEFGTDCSQTCPTTARETCGGGVADDRVATVPVWEPGIGPTTLAAGSDSDGDGWPDLLAGMPGWQPLLAGEGRQCRIQELACEADADCAAACPEGSDCACTAGLCQACATEWRCVQANIGGAPCTSSSECVNGTCDGQRCACDAGWCGERCDAPLLDGVCRDCGPALVCHALDTGVCGDSDPDLACTPTASGGAQCAEDAECGANGTCAAVLGGGACSADSECLAGGTCDITSRTCRCAEGRCGARCEHSAESAACPRVCRCAAGWCGATCDDSECAATCRPDRGAPGKVALYGGGFPGAPALRREWVGEPGDRFGSAVAFLGDVDGDGRAEVAVGSPATDRFGPASGKVVVFAGADHAPLYTLYGPRASGAFGAALSPAAPAALADVDGDRAPDLAVGAIGNNATTGRVYIHSGATGARMIDIAGREVNNKGQVLASESRGQRFGATLAWFGPGLLAVGAPAADGNGSLSGAVHIFDVSAAAASWLATGTVVTSLGATPVRVFPGDLPEARLGESLAARGLVVVACSQEADCERACPAGQTCRCEAGACRTCSGPGSCAALEQWQVVAGAPGANESITIIGCSGGEGSWTCLRSPAAGIRAPRGADEDGDAGKGMFGAAVGDAGDLDGDGFPDIAVGAPLAAIGADAVEAGQVVVLSGRVAAGDGTVSGRVYSAGGARIRGEFGRTVAFAGDMNRDGSPDLAVGSPGKAVACQVDGDCLSSCPAGALCRCAVATADEGGGLACESCNAFGTCRKVTQALVDIVQSYRYCVDAAICGHGTCNDGVAGDGRCTCAMGWSLDPGTRTCTVTNVCDGRCGAGTCVVDPSAPDGYFCACPTGYGGTDCVQSCPGVWTGGAPGGCGGVPTDGCCAGGWTYACQGGHVTGQRGCSGLPACPTGSFSGCGGHGVCAAGTGGFNPAPVCRCRPGWTGVTCSTPVDFCAPDPCQNGGVCQNVETNGTRTGYRCTCPEGWWGPNCAADCPKGPTQTGRQRFSYPFASAAEIADWTTAFGPDQAFAVSGGRLTVALPDEEAMIATPALWFAGEGLDDFRFVADLRAGGVGPAGLAWNVGGAGGAHTVLLCGSGPSCAGMTNQFMWSLSSATTSFSWSAGDTVQVVVDAADGWLTVSARNATTDGALVRVLGPVAAPALQSARFGVYSLQDAGTSWDDLRVDRRLYDTWPFGFDAPSGIADWTRLGAGSDTFTVSGGALRTAGGTQGNLLVSPSLWDVAEGLNDFVFTARVRPTAGAGRFGVVWDARGAADGQHQAVWLSGDGAVPSAQTVTWSATSQTYRTEGAALSWSPGDTLEVSVSVSGGASCAGSCTGNDCQCASVSLRNVTVGSPAVTVLGPHFAPTLRVARFGVSVSGMSGVVFDDLTVTRNAARCSGVGQCSAAGTCVCPPGYGGAACEFDLNDCGAVLDGDCGTGSCVDGAQSWTCACPPGTYGPTCDRGFDPNANGLLDPCDGTLTLLGDEPSQPRPAWLPAPQAVAFENRGTEAACVAFVDLYNEPPGNHPYVLQVLAPNGQILSSSPFTTTPVGVGDNTRFSRTFGTDVGGSCLVRVASGQWVSLRSRGRGVPVAWVPDRPSEEVWAWSGGVGTTPVRLGSARAMVRVGLSTGQPCGNNGACLPAAGGGGDQGVTWTFTCQCDQNQGSLDFWCGDLCRAECPLSGGVYCGGRGSCYCTSEGGAACSCSGPTAPAPQAENLSRGGRNCALGDTCPTAVEIDRIPSGSYCRETASSVLPLADFDVTNRYPGQTAWKYTNTGPRDPVTAPSPGTPPADWLWLSGGCSSYDGLDLAGTVDRTRGPDRVFRLDVTPAIKAQADAEGMGRVTLTLQRVVNSTSRPPTRLSGARDLAPAYPLGALWYARSAGTCTGIQNTTACRLAKAAGGALSTLSVVLTAADVGQSLYFVGDYYMAGQALDPGVGLEAGGGPAAGAVVREWWPTRHTWSIEYGGCVPGDACTNSQGLFKVCGGDTCPGVGGTYATAQCAADAAGARLPEGQGSYGGVKDCDCLQTPQVPEGGCDDLLARASKQDLQYGTYCDDWWGRCVVPGDSCQYPMMTGAPDALATKVPGAYDRAWNRSLSVIEVGRTAGFPREGAAYARPTTAQGVDTRKLHDYYHFDVGDCRGALNESLGHGAAEAVYHIRPLQSGFYRVNVLGAGGTGSPSYDVVVWLTRAAGACATTAPQHYAPAGAHSLVVGAETRLLEEPALEMASQCVGAVNLNDGPAREVLVEWLDAGTDYFVLVDGARAGEEGVHTLTIDWATELNGL